MKVLILMGAAFAMSVGMALAQNALPTSPAAEVKWVCASCHGADGHSVLPIFPDLAGQRAAYLERQLRRFRAESRADPNARAYMWGVTSDMSNAMIKGLAQYFARQRPAAGSAQDRTLVAAGRKLFDNGDPAQTISPCQSCHGSEGQGRGAFPRLAGQHFDYLVGQILAFRTATRVSVIMHANVQGMTHKQIKEVAAYLASL